MLKKSLLFCGLSIFATALTALAVCLFLNMKSAGELKKAEQRLLEMGAAMSLEEILLPNVPEDQNAAPLYHELERLVENSPNFDQNVVLLQTLIYGHDFEKSQRSIRLMELSEDEWHEFSAILKSIEDISYFDIIESICERPYFRPDWDYRVGPNLIIPKNQLTEVNAASEAIYYLLYRASNQHRLGNNEAVVSCIENAFVLTEHMAQGQLLFSILSSLAKRGQAHLRLEIISSRDPAFQLSDPTVFDFSVRDFWLGALNMERVAMADRVYEILKKSDNEAYAKISSESIPFMYRNNFSLTNWHLNEDYNSYLNSMADALEYAQMNHAQQLAIAEEAKEKHDLIDKGKLICKTMLPYTLIAERLMFEADTRNALAKTGFALAAYYSDKGTFPEDLYSLIPSYLKEIPTDPFSGEPLIYKITDGGYALYSIGPNQKDDGGYEDYDSIREGDLNWSGFGSTLERKYYEYD